MNNISANLLSGDCTSLLQSIFWGDYGLLTTTPKYLFCVLFPVLLFLGFLTRLMPRIPLLRSGSPVACQFLYGMLGLGCTTAALTALDNLSEPSAKTRIAWILTLLVPCSAKFTIILAFASMVTLPVFGTFLFFASAFGVFFYFLLGRFCPLSPAAGKPSDPSEPISLHMLFAVIRNAFQAVCKTAPAFACGSVLISTAVWLGIFDKLALWSSPVLEDFLHLPPEAFSLLLLGIFKRDFAAAALLSFGSSGIFNAAQLTVTVLMMTFSVPCFNSSILLVRQQRLPGAAVIWLGSLLSSVLIGKVVSTVLFVCLF